MQCAGFLSGPARRRRVHPLGDLPPGAPRGSRVPCVVLSLVGRRVGDPVRRLGRPRGPRGLRLGDRAPRPRGHLRRRRRRLRPRGRRFRGGAGLSRLRDAHRRRALGQALRSGGRIGELSVLLAGDVREERDHPDRRGAPGLPAGDDRHAADRRGNARETRADAGGSLPPPDAPGEPADQRGGPEEPRPAGREGLQQHPEVRQHDRGHASARVSRSEAGRKDPARATSCVSPRSARDCTGEPDSCARDDLDAGHSARAARVGRSPAPRRLVAAAQPLPAGPLGPRRQLQGAAGDQRPSLPGHRGARRALPQPPRAGARRGRRRSRRARSCSPTPPR